MAKKPTDHGAVAAKFDDMKMKRGRRFRKPGDGEGCDVGLGIVGRDLEKLLDALPRATRLRMASHINEHAQEALKPILRVIERTGNMSEVEFMSDVGGNMLRTLVEFLEDESKK